MDTQRVRIPVYKPTIAEAEKKYVERCLETEWISSKGEFVSRFENEFAAYTKAKYALTVSNGTTALHVALLALGIGVEDEVIVPTLSSIASANAITYTGAKPVFVDCDPVTWQMDPDDVCRAITSKTRAIMPVHLYGQPCDMKSLCSIAQKHGLLMVEDCAEALGSFVEEKHVGTFGDIGTFSFYGNKTITTGEGGMLITNNPNLADRISHIKGQGLARSREYWHDIIGYNYRMTNICAAIGCGQLERISEILDLKKRLALRYRKQLDGLVHFQGERDGSIHSHWMVCFLVAEANQRDRLRESLMKNGIETRPVFYPIHSMPMYARSYRRMPYSDDIGSRGLNVPSYPALSDDDVDYICTVIRESI
jgi:perosamine synthetase